MRQCIEIYGGSNRKGGTLDRSLFMQGKRSEAIWVDVPSCTLRAGVVLASFRAGPQRHPGGPRQSGRAVIDQRGLLLRGVFDSAGVQQ